MANIHPACVPVSEMTCTVSSGTLNGGIRYHTTLRVHDETVNERQIKITS